MQKSVSSTRFISRLRQQAVSSAGLALLLAGGCTAASQQSQIEAHVADQNQAAAAGMEQHCQTELAQHEAYWCNAEEQQGLAFAVASRPEGESYSGDFRRQIESSYAQRCTAPSLQPALTRLDGCITALAQLEQEERAAQQERLPDVRGKEAAIRQDPEYVAAMDLYERRQHARRVAADNLKVARAERNTGLASYQQAFDRADADVQASTEQLKQLFEARGVDWRDASYIGLW